MCHDGALHILQHYNARLVLMLHITVDWRLWYTGNGRLSVESQEKRYTRRDRSLSSVRKVWVTQIKVQIPVRRTKVDTSSVQYRMFIQKMVPGISLQPQIRSKYFALIAWNASRFVANNTRTSHTTCNISTLTYQWQHARQSREPNLPDNHSRTPVYALSFIVSKFRAG